MGIAILASPEIYNFSELLEQPLLKTLENSNFKWVYELLNIFNQGDIQTYNNVIDNASGRDVLLDLFRTNCKSIESQWIKKYVWCHFWN